jgi:riboflavin kinase/FMN adenylyltransferase
LHRIDWDSLVRRTVELDREPRAAAVGVFDGLHRGHAELIRQVTARGHPAVVTFRENPRKLLAPGDYQGDIFTLRRKLEVLEEYGVEEAVVIDFSEKFSKLKGQEFIALMEGLLHVGFLVIGSNFRCGFRQDTDASFIKTMNEKLGIETCVVPQVVEGGFPVSSSRIRAAIRGGDLAAAASMLGRNPDLDLRGIVPCTAGSGKGWYYEALRLGRIIPAPGSYPALVQGGGCFRTVVSVDTRGVLIPSYEGFDPENAVSVEFLIETLKF